MSGSKIGEGAALPELSFRDAAGDDVSFRLSRQRQLEAWGKYFVGFRHPTRKLLIELGDVL